MKYLRGHALLMGLALFSASALGNGQKRIAITIDDLPVESATPITVEESAALNRSILAALKRHQVKAVGFVNEDRLLVSGKIDAGVAILNDWLGAGMELGNHNHGHVGLWASSLSENMDAVLKGEVFTRWLSVGKGVPLRYYRHPYTQTGKNDDEQSVFEDFLAARGYTVAPFTIEHGDYIFACVYDKLPAQDARREQVAAEYDMHLRQSVGIFERMTDELFGRQIPQVLLIHASRLNAATLDRSLSTLKELGYQFVSLDEALKDEAYQTPAKASRRFGPSWLARWARAKGVKLSAYGQEAPGGMSAELHQALCSE